ncbi:MAG: cell division topological specificity factor MinE [SAR324 cluster bacterium]|nr:cell division topological specificity factor MinE [SAR324 cluster bacterium]
MLEMLKTLFNPGSGSAETAKNRLRLVLARERVGLPESQLTELKGELCDVISKYFEIDKTALEIEIMNKNGQSALSVNTPVNAPTH